MAQWIESVRLRNRGAVVRLQSDSKIEASVVCDHASHSVSRIQAGAVEKTPSLG